MVLVKLLCVQLVLDLKEVVCRLRNQAMIEVLKVIWRFAEDL